MRRTYLGDSYDIVKQSLLRWLGNFGGWSVHPMFTEPWVRTDVVALESLLGAKIVSREVLTSTTDRSVYFACGSSCGHLFLDPNTGLRMRSKTGADVPQYVFASELQRLVEQRPGSLTAVFDQSVGRGSESIQLQTKLQELSELGVFGFAYVSHACFVVAGHDRSLVDRARARVMSESRLPEDRILSVPPVR
jgi:hypothetical protein